MVRDYGTDRKCRTTADHIDLAHALLSAIGEVVDLASENQMDAVTGGTGSGPAYVFYMIDALAKAGEAQGLSPDLAMQLAKATVAGAGALAKASEERPKSYGSRHQSEWNNTGGA